MFAILKLPITEPTAPALGTITIVGPTALSIPLDRPSTGPTTLAAYDLERSTDGSTWTTVAFGIAIFGESNLYADTGLAASTTYTYRARVVDTTLRYSTYSAPVVATTPSDSGADVPVSVAVVQSGVGLLVSWAAGASGADSFTLYRKGSTESSYWARSMGTATSLLDDGMGANTTWSYYVTATLAGQASGPSAIVTGTTPASSVNLKWYPGHYATPDALLIPGKESAHSTLWTQIAPISNFVGGKLTVPWGQIETTQGVYDWSTIETQIAALSSIGKKTAVTLSAARYYSGALPSTPQTGIKYFPDYLIDDGYVVTAPATSPYAHVLTIWRAAAMDRYMALFAAFAAQYDNDDRVSLVITVETSLPYRTDDGTYSSANFATQITRLANYLPTVFSRTPAILQLNFMPDHYDTDDIMQECVDNGCGMGGPDMFIPSLTSNDNWGQRTLRGARWNGSAWIEYVGPDQRSAVAVCMQKQGARSTSDTPALYYDAARNRYDCTHTTWAAQNPAYLTSSGTLVPAMDWPNVLSYIRDNPVPLRTTVPTNLA